MEQVSTDNKQPAETVKPAKHPGGRPRIFKTPEEMEAKANEYFKACDSVTETIVTKQGDTITIPKPRNYNMASLAYALGFASTTQLPDYASDHPEFSEVVKRLRLKVESRTVEATQNGEINVIGGIFTLKNHYNWHDKQEIDINSAVSVAVEQMIEVLKTYASPEKIESAIIDLQSRLARLDAANA